MLVTDKNIKLKLRHEIRYYSFSVRDIPQEKKYYESPWNSLFGLLVVLVIAAIIFYFSSHKDVVIKVALFSIVFCCYKIFLAFTKPIIALNKNGIELRAVNIPWRNISSLDLIWNSHNLYLEFRLKNGKVTKEKVENLNFQLDYIYLEPIIRSFRRKNRTKYIFKKE